MKKINIAEILKDCPNGMELYSPIFGKVYLDKVRPHLAIVVTTDKGQGGSKEEFLYDGRYGMNGECMLFPSKGKNTWKYFHRPFVDGDILVHTQNGMNAISIYNCVKSDVGSFVIVNCHAILWGKSGCLAIVNREIVCYDEYVRFATDEEKQKLFDAIKDNGYKWNPEIKTFEKLIEPTFKVGDRIRHDDEDVIYTINGVYSSMYGVEERDFGISIEDQDNYELVHNKIDISTLTPFESRVLVRNADGDLWKPAIYGFSHSKGCYVVGGVFWRQCIPYEVNKGLLGTTNNPKEYGSE